MNSMKVSFILSMCLHLLLLGVGSFLKPKTNFYSPRYTVTLIQGEGREVRTPQIKSRKVTKVEKKPYLKKEKKIKKEEVTKIKKQEVAKKVDPPEIKKTQPQVKVKEAKVREERKPGKKESEIDKSYDEVQKTIAQIKEKKKEEEKAEYEEQEYRESVQQSIKDIQERLLERKIVTGSRQEHIVANQNSPYEAYYVQVWGLIEAKWSYPLEFDKKKGLLTVISVKLYRDGSIQDIQFESRSGEPLFDKSAEMAIKRVGSFPPFPSEMPMESIEIGFRFSPLEG